MTTDNHTLDELLLDAKALMQMYQAGWLDGYKHHAFGKDKRSYKRDRELIRRLRVELRNDFEFRFVAKMQSQINKKQPNESKKGGVK